jgi:hypothetical protein
VDATQERIRQLHEKSLIAPQETPALQQSPNKVWRGRMQRGMRELREKEPNPAAQVGGPSPLAGAPVAAPSVEVER